LILHELAKMANLLAFRFTRETLAWTPIRFAD
jgi:hypothetical protein